MSLGGLEMQWKGPHRCPEVTGKRESWWMLLQPWTDCLMRACTQTSMYSHKNQENIIIRWCFDVRLPRGLIFNALFCPKVWTALHRTENWKENIKRFDFMVKLENLCDVNTQNNPGSNSRRGHNVLKISSNSPLWLCFWDSQGHVCGGIVQWDVFVFQINVWRLVWVIDV